MRDITGRCHCGNITFDFLWPGAAEEIPVRACSCSFCRKHGAVYTSHPDGRLRARIGDPARARRYRFGQQTADFHVCGECGVILFATSVIDATEYAVINVNTFENVAPEAMTRTVTNFDGESIEARLARRKRNWTPHVVIEYPGS